MNDNYLSYRIMEMLNSENAIWVFALSLMLCGVVVSLLLTTILRRKRKTPYINDLSKRIVSTSTTLHSIADEIDFIQMELEKRIEIVEKLKKDAEFAEKAMSITKPQTEVIGEVIDRKLKAENKRNFWTSFAMSFTFFILGAAATYFISMLFTKPV